MVKLILPNSAPPGQESQKCPENSATDLVTPRKTRAFVTSRQSKNFSVGHRAQREKNYDLGHLAHRTARGDQWLIFLWAWGDEVRPLCTNFRDIFGPPCQEEPSWAKWVSPLNLSMKTTNFKPNLYFYHRIPLISCNIAQSLNRVNLNVPKIVIS